MNRLLEDLAGRVEETLGTNRMQTFVTGKSTENSESGNMPNDPGRGKNEAVGKAIDAFARQYGQAVQEYRLRQLSPDMSAFEAMARSMIPRKNDKFALAFLQHDTMALFDMDNVRGLCMTKGFPDSIYNELAVVMGKVEEQVKNIFNVRIFSEQLKSLFIQANIQFHLLTLSPDQK